MKEKGVTIPTQNVFVVSDIHGHAGEFEKLLSHWDIENEKLLLLGDYGDRGPDSALVFHMVKGLVESGKAIAIGGNHEDLFLDFLDSPNTEGDLFIRNGGGVTLPSFCEGISHFSDVPLEVWANMIKRDFPDMITFLKELPFYIEMGDWIFVHAGINPSHKNWKDTSENEFRWIRERFYRFINETGKKIMFGHTMIHTLPNGNGQPIWISPDKTLFGIDGGLCAGGRLNGVRIHNNTIKEVVIQKSNEKAFVIKNELS